MILLKILVALAFIVISGVIGYSVGLAFGLWGVPISLVVGVLFGKAIAEVLNRMDRF